MSTHCLFFTLIYVLVCNCNFVASSHGGAQHNRSFLARQLAGIRERFHWMTSPFTAQQEQYQRPPHTVQVAQVGFGRTGTTSLEAALKILGYSPLQDDLVYQVTDLFAQVHDNQINMDQWAEAMGQRGFDYVYFCHSDYLEWVASRQDIQVILGVRDNATVWAKSWLTVASFSDIFQHAPFCYLQTVQDMLPTLHAMQVLHTNNHTEKSNDIATLEAAYTDHLKRVQQMIPPERLLVFNVKDGWEPLCSFLDKPVPNVDFPHVNDRVVMSALIATLWSVVYLWQVLKVGLIICGGYLAYCMMVKVKQRRKKKGE